MVVRGQFLESDQVGGITLRRFSSRSVYCFIIHTHENKSYLACVLRPSFPRTVSPEF